MHIYWQKNNFNFISIWSEIMSLKSDRLEMGLRIYTQAKHMKKYVE